MKNYTIYKKKNDKFLRRTYTQPDPSLTKEISLIHLIAQTTTYTRGIGLISIPYKELGNPAPRGTTRQPSISNWILV